MLKKIETAYANLSYPGDEQLVGTVAESTSDVYRMLKGIRWQEFKSLDDMKKANGRNGGGFFDYHCLSYLNSKAYVYFLPAIMTVLMNESHDDNIAGLLEENILLKLHNEYLDYHSFEELRSYLYDGISSKELEKSYIESKLANSLEYFERHVLLIQEQKETISEFLVYIIYRFESDTGYEHYEGRNVLNKFWKEFLSENRKLDLIEAKLIEK